MALLDEKLDPRFSAGKIGGPPTVRSFPNVHTSPSADHSGEFMGNTRNVLEQGGADVRKAYEQGGIGPAVGMLARAATAGPLAVLDDVSGGRIGGAGRGRLAPSGAASPSRTRSGRRTAPVSCPLWREEPSRPPVWGDGCGFEVRDLRRTRWLPAGRA